ncbi:DUF6264 family protein [Clavibacter tessellarius]|uniref:Uncharacterized protein n=1 Tax=Clavibacter tessellarius TaxID=31965 RepID=A0A154V188_9MICO|nr:DUF6264 family protein [Clavibacter michiganensis]KZC95121.1 hypothetical protein AWH51_10115 [Clavibacter michiganensis subsp. tessellarius]
MSYDEYEHAFDEAPRAGVRRSRVPWAGRREPRERKAPGWGDRVAVVILLGVEGIVACGAYLQVLLSGMFFDRCADPSLTCDYALGDVVMTTARAAVAVVVILSVVAVVLRSVRRRSAWWVPLVGCVVLVAVTYGTGGLMDLAAT